ncbi:GntR family transcriptional regulator [Novosphingobium sp. BL-52-GroH]|uniref:GntR family transcriptional regulator n=1 Tax=Novosphingobium sp. BL-52-GroH TaxID=3349877 RepID=UPI00384FB29F
MTTAFEQAYLSIRDMILHGELRAGDSLFPDELARQCGVSRTPVREALFRLEAELFVTRLDNKRMIVRAWTIDEIEVFVELRMRVGGYVAARAATRISAKDIEALRALNEELGQVAASAVPDQAAALAAASRFYEIMVPAAESDRLTTLSWQLANPAPLVRLLEQHAGQRLADMLAAHRELVEAFAARDARWAEAAMIVLVRKTYRTDLIAELVGGTGVPDAGG